MKKKGEVGHERAPWRPSSGLGNGPANLPAHASQQLGASRNTGIVVANTEGAYFYHSVSDRGIFGLLDLPMVISNNHFTGVRGMLGEGDQSSRMSSSVAWDGMRELALRNSEEGTARC